MVRIAIAAGALCLAAPAASRSDEVAERKAALIETLISDWPDVGAPAAKLYAPDRYPLGARAAWGKETQRAVMEKRAKAVVEYILSRPALRGTGITIELEPEIRAVGDHVDATLNFLVTTQGGHVMFKVSMNTMVNGSGSLEENGTSPGGCPIFYFRDAPGIDMLLLRRKFGHFAVPNLRIEILDKVQLTDMDEEEARRSPEGRVAAALYSLDCEYMLDLANAPSHTAGLEEYEPDF
jgi:hypothetical protein